MNLKKTVLLGIIGFIVFNLLVTFSEQGNELSPIHSFTDALWFSLVTLSTVGYGDMVPVTPWGRFFAVFLIFASVGLLGFIIGGISEAIQNYREKQKMGLTGTNFTNHIVIIGWDLFARSVAMEIIKSGRKVGVITDKKDIIDIICAEFDQKDMFCLFAPDLLDLSKCKHMNIDKAFMVFYNLQTDADNLIGIINAKEEFKEPDFLVSMKNKGLRKTFLSAGVTYTISSDDITSHIVASFIFEPQVANFTTDLISHTNDLGDSDIQQFRITATSPFKDMRYREVFNAIKDSFNAVAIGLSKLHEGEYQLHKLPEDSLIVKESDYLIIVVKTRNAKVIAKYLGVSEGLT